MTDEQLSAVNEERQEVQFKAGETIFTVSDETSPSGSSFQGVAKSANELKNTVTNWDSSLWKEGGNGYPVFKWSK